MDVHDKQTRSYNMSRIKSRDTKPELIVRRLCHSLGLRFRLQNKDLKGSPDLTFKKHKTVIFVNGCFWHSHNCPKGNVYPKTNAIFWNDKRSRTKERDIEILKFYDEIKWKVLVIWECETKDLVCLSQKISSHFSDKQTSDTSLYSCPND
ncbi:MAG: DNA mismatch endonuclease Vsr [Geobacteraceae bacterium]|nr:DNA mismatch endonuclease Vsr [Geobacteraceae bacterium]